MGLPYVLLGTSSKELGDSSVFISNFVRENVSKDDAAVRSLSEELEELIFQQSAARTLRSFPGGYQEDGFGNFLANFLLEHFGTPSHEKKMFEGLGP